MKDKNYTNNLIVAGLIAYAGWSVWSVFETFTPTRKLNPTTKRAHDKIVEREVCLAESIVRLGDAIKDPCTTTEELNKIYREEIVWLNSVLD